MTRETRRSQNRKRQETERRSTTSGENKRKQSSRGVRTDPTVRCRRSPDKAVSLSRTPVLCLSELPRHPPLLLAPSHLHSVRSAGAGRWEGEGESAEGSAGERVRGVVYQGHLPSILLSAMFVFLLFCRQNTLSYPVGANVVGSHFVSFLYFFLCF